MIWHTMLQSIKSYLKFFAWILIFTHLLSTLHTLSSDNNYLLPHHLILIVSQELIFTIFAQSLSMQCLVVHQICTSMIFHLLLPILHLSLLTGTRKSLLPVWLTRIMLMVWLPIVVLRSSLMNVIRKIKLRLMLSLGWILQLVLLTTFCACSLLLVLLLFIFLLLFPLYMIRAAGARVDKILQSPLYVIRALE